MGSSTELCIKFTNVKACRLLLLCCYSFVISLGLNNFFMTSFFSLFEFGRKKKNSPLGHIFWKLKKHVLMHYRSIVKDMHSSYISKQSSVPLFSTIYTGLILETYELHLCLKDPNNSSEEMNDFIPFSAVAFYHVIKGMLLF